MGFDILGLIHLTNSPPPPFFFLFSHLHFLCLSLATVICIIKHRTTLWVWRADIHTCYCLCQREQDWEGRGEEGGGRRGGEGDEKEKERRGKEKEERKKRGEEGREIDCISSNIMYKPHPFLVRLISTKWHTDHPHPLHTTLQCTWLSRASVRGMLLGLPCLVLLCTFLAWVDSMDLVWCFAMLSESKRPG